MLSLLLTACSPVVLAPRVDPTFIEVQLETTQVGSEEAPLPFTSDAVTLPLSLQVLRSDRSPMTDFNGDLAVKVRPGKLQQDDVITVTGGVWSGSISLKNGFGPTRLWVTDEGDRDPDSTRVPSFAAGVTEPVWYAFPTIAEMQATTDHETNQLAGEFAELRAVDRQIIVAARDTAGMWVTDVADPPGSGNSLYVYTFSRPDDELAEGAQLTLLNGIDQEYLASTQISYPTTLTSGASFAVPAPIVLTGESACNDSTMELNEASRVRADSWQVPSTFTPDSADYADFVDYGQWPLQLGSCTIYVESGATALDFYPPDYAGQTIASVGGMLKEIYGKWIIVVIDSADLDIGSATRRRTHHASTKVLPR